MRVAVYLPKQFETVISLVASSMTGAVFVPINPVLKAQQVGHILRDCGVSLLITSTARAEQLAESLPLSNGLHTIVLVDNPCSTNRLRIKNCQVINWQQLCTASSTTTPLAQVENDLAAILYTSGSTGQPKGVMLSHRNLIAGAESVANYLNNDTNDHLLAALPLSFDAGLSQVTTALISGATSVLLEYLLPNDLRKAVLNQKITGITAVPPLWHQIASLNWQPGEGDGVRYFANTGGHMPRPLLDRLRTIFPNAKPFLMYGLTEAFRSTYLPPDQVDQRSESIGKAIPNAEIKVLRQDGRECAVDEVGELVHRGPLVSQGYWNDPVRTAARFKPIPSNSEGEIRQELAVWSGDLVRRDAEGYLYFVARSDEMIKSSGYRISPTELEELIYQRIAVNEVVALGAPHPTLGQGIVLVIYPQESNSLSEESVRSLCRQELPGYMQPHHIRLVNTPLPLNSNGKLDRAGLSTAFAETFLERS